ncbi:MAG: pyridoxine 5'-phosphate synthase [Verrucomicrobiota bacterium]
MTKLSVNINKVALIRNSRGRDYPSVRDFAARCLDFGAHGITLHPRPDQRHARYSDITELKSLCDERGAELNVEGYPCDEFMAAVCAARPAQCTLVPDAPGQLTSDHGWRIAENEALLRRVIGELRAREIRVSLFIDYDSEKIEAAKAIGTDRVELYTEPYAEAFGSPKSEEMVAGFRAAALKAHQAGLEVNAGHDLNLENLAAFLAIVPHVEEVSIGHALIVECLASGLPTVIGRYLDILAQAEKVEDQTAGQRG